MSEVIFTSDNFEQDVLQSDVPVLVDFWAPWCGPCRVQGPIIEKLAEEFKGKKVKIGKLNVDENNEVAMKFQIMSIPTIMVFKNGKSIDQMVGLQKHENLTQKLEELAK